MHLSLFMSSNSQLQEILKEREHDEDQNDKKIQIMSFFKKDYEYFSFKNFFRILSTLSRFFHDFFQAK